MEKALERYLKGHLEPDLIKEYEPPPSFALAQKPLGDVIYEDAGVFAVERNNTKLTVKYDFVDETTVSVQVLNKLDEELQQLNHSMDPITFELVTFHLSSSGFRKLTSFTIEQLDPQVRADISDFLPPNVTILFNSVDKTVKTGGETMVVGEGDKKAYLILLFGDLAVPESLLILLHEIGHVIGEHLTNDQAMSQNVLIEQSRIIRAERDAHAFLLKFIQPFIRKGNEIFSRRNINYFIHSALRGYSYGALDRKSVV